MDSRQSALMAYRAGVRANGARAAALEAGLKPHKKKRRHRHHHDPPPAGALKADINVTPLVDVCLVLLIIFMVVTPMLHRGPEVQLPQTKNHTNHQDTGEQIVVSVRSDGTYVEADKVDLDKLETVLEKELKTPRPVNVRADYTLKFGEVRKVLEKVHASGAPVVNMETKENKE
jgi:biopolymer transport protein TolR